MTFLQLLEQKHFGRLNKAWIHNYAKNSSDFCNQWLIHSIRSNASHYELGLALSFAEKWQLDMFFMLENYLDEIVNEDLTFNYSYIETIKLIEVIHNDFSTNRIKKLLAQLDFISKPASPRDCDKVNIQTKKVSVPQALLDSLVEQTEPHLKEVTLFGDDGPGSKNKNIRNNRHFPTPLPNGFLELAILERLMAASLNESIDKAEPAVILCYENKQYYHWHYDAIHPHNQSIQQQISQFGQRAKTAIFYINDNFTGGETQFKKPFLSISPMRGNIISFNNCDSKNNKLKESIHRGAEVISGKKWIITLWFRSKPFWLRSGFL